MLLRMSVSFYHHVTVLPVILRSFSLWARHPAETSAELNVRSGAAEFFPGASRQVRRVRKRRREGNARAAQGTASGRESYTIQTCDPSLSRTAVRWGPQLETMNAS